MEETSTDMEALARRAVACPKWRWVPGTADTRGGRVVNRLTFAGGVKLDNPSIQYAGPNGGTSWHSEDGFTKNGPTGLMPLAPDLSDRATLGCLEGLVAEAWNAPLVYVEPCGGGFEARRFEVRNLLGRMADGFPVEAFVNVSGPTKVAALVLALEAAP